MSTSPISGSSSNYLQSILNSVFQDAGLTGDSNTTGGVSALFDPSLNDNSELSPFSQVLSTLQQLQQTDPTKYEQVTKQIAENLQTAASTAQSQGNTTMANQLSQLASDFLNASKSDQLPNIQDLALAIAGHHRHHHHAFASSSGDSSSIADDSSSGFTSLNSANSAASETSNQALHQFLQSLQANSSQDSTLNPMSIIVRTLGDAGVISANN